MPKTTSRTSRRKGGSKGTGHAVKANVQIADVTRALWSVGLICDSGLQVTFWPAGTSAVNADKARSDSLRPRETDGGLEAVDEKVVEYADVEVLDFEEDDGKESADELPEAEGEVIEANESEDDCAPRRVAPDPGAPTQQQIDDHEIDHMPYRCWCEACVAGRSETNTAPDPSHRSQ